MVVISGGAADMVRRSAVGFFRLLRMQRLKFCEIDLVLIPARSRGPSFPL
jgi:hypothetical protein